AGGIQGVRSRQRPARLPERWLHRPRPGGGAARSVAAGAGVGRSVMDHFRYRDRVLHCEDVPLPVLAQTYGTPLYVYSQATLLHHLGQIQRAFASASPLICYSIKTNGNLSICRLMAGAGSGFDVTSGGELYRALAALPPLTEGARPGDRIVFAGVGKTDPE